MSTFGENIKELRTSRGYTQDKFAKVIGSNQVNVSAWEVGTRTPTLATIRRIAATFRVPLSSLISVSDSQIEEDFEAEVSDVIRRDPKVMELFEHVRYMSDEDLSVVLTVARSLTKKNTNE